MTTNLNAKMTLTELYALWANLGDVPTVFDGDDVDCLEEPFHTFPAGTPREDVWHWFEGQNSDFIVGDVMQGIRRSEAAVGEVQHA